MTPFVHSEQFNTNYHQSASLRLIQIKSLVQIKMDQIPERNEDITKNKSRANSYFNKTNFKLLHYGF